MFAIAIFTIAIFTIAIFTKFSAFMPELFQVPAYFCISSIKLLQVK